MFTINIFENAPIEFELEKSATIWNMKNGYF